MGANETSGPVSVFGVIFNGSISSMDVHVEIAREAPIRECTLAMEWANIAGNVSNEC